jgi:hypothetical protein
MHPQNPALPLTRAGVVVRLNGELRFLSAHSVRRFVAPPAISDVSGTGLTMALVDGQVLAIIAVGSRGSALTVCEVAGELVGLLGLEPVDVGFFDAEGSGVSFHGRTAKALDVDELVGSSARTSHEHLEEA